MSRSAASIPLAFRYLCLTSRYRHKLEYTDASLGAARRPAWHRSGSGSPRWARRRAMGRGTPPAALRAGAADDRPVGTVDRIAGNGDGSQGGA